MTPMAERAKECTTIPTLGTVGQWNGFERPAGPMKQASEHSEASRPDLWARSKKANIP